VTLANRIRSLELGAPPEPDDAGTPPPDPAAPERAIAALAARRVAADAQLAAWRCRLGAGAREADIVAVLHDIDAAVRAEQARLAASPGDAAHARVLAVERRLFEACGHEIAEAAHCAALAALIASWGHDVAPNEIATLVRRTATDRRAAAELADALVAAARAYLKQHPA
jgi:hypothetical protein